MKTKKTVGRAPRQSQAMQSQSDYESCAARLKALADPDRLWIVNTLLKGVRNVSALANESGMPIDKVSHHLGVLRAARLVEAHKQGRFINYSLTAEVASAVEDDRIQTIDLGCCQLDLVQPKLPVKKTQARSHATRSRKP